MAEVTQSRWYVVHSQPNAELRAARHMAQQGFEVYLPRYRKRRRHARRIETVNAPLFPRYLFVSLDLECQRWRAINSTVGVSHLVCHGDEPAVIPSSVIAEIRSREDGHGLVALDIVPRFRPGDKIVIAHGVFSNCHGLFESMTDQDRVAVLLDLLGRKVRVVLEEDTVVAA